MLLDNTSSSAFVKINVPGAKKLVLDLRQVHNTLIVKMSETRLITPVN